MNEDAADSQRFTVLFDATSPRVFAYVRRHIEASLVEDVVSETFLVAWRRLAEIPADPLPWLLVVARNVLANQRRALARRGFVHLEQPALEQLAGAAPAVDDAVIERASLLRAVSALSPGEREVLLLIAWDGLTVAAAAAVLGCSPGTFAVRLHRARRSLDRAMTENHPDPRPDRPIVKETT